MLRFIGATLTAMKNALAWVAGMAFGMITFPFRLFGAPRGRSAVPPVTQSQVELAERTKVLAADILEASQPANYTTVGMTQLLNASKAVTWARDLVSGKAPNAPLPEALPMSARAWLGNLRRNELELLASSRPKAVAAHMCGRALLEGLPPATRLSSSNPPKAAVIKRVAAFAGDARISGPDYRENPRRSPRPKQSLGEEPQSFGLA